MDLDSRGSTGSFWEGSATSDESNYLNAAFSCPWHAIIPSAGSRLSKGLDSMYLQLWRGRKMGGRGTLEDSSWKQLS